MKLIKRLLRYLPNLLTILRIFGAFLLLRTTPFSFSFYSVYLFCGLSDMLDGWLARLTGSCSPLGAVLDSIADAVFTFMALAAVLPALAWRPWMLYWITGIALLRICSLGIGFFRFHTFSSLHTLANKGTGGLLFAFPLLMAALGFHSMVSIVCCVATLSALEELVILLRMKTLNRNIRGWFELK